MEAWSDQRGRLGDGHHAAHVGGSGKYSNARGYAEGTESDEGGMRYILHVEK